MSRVSSNFRLEAGRQLDELRDYRSTLLSLALWPEPRPKPEGSRRASAREARSPGEQSSTCRASMSLQRLLSCSRRSRPALESVLSRIRIAGNGGPSSLLAREGAPAWKLGDKIGMEGGDAATGKPPTAVEELSAKLTGKAGKQGQPRFWDREGPSNPASYQGMRHRGMERLWSLAVNRWQMGTPRKRLEQAETVATPGDQLRRASNGKEEVE
jgi:hypothetical protein